MDEDVITQLIIETERLREELSTQNGHFQREIVKIQEGHLKQINKHVQHFEREYTAQQEHIQKQFEEELDRFNIEQRKYLDENERLRRENQGLCSTDNSYFRQKFESESEITDLLSRRIKILESELESLKAKTRTN